MYYSASHHIASHHNVLHRITSHCIISHHITSHHTTSQCITSHHNTMYYISSHPIPSHLRTRRPRATSSETGGCERSGRWGHTCPPQRQCIRGGSRAMHVGWGTNLHHPSTWCRRSPRHSLGVGVGECGVDEALGIACKPHACHDLTSRHAS